VKKRIDYNVITVYGGVFPSEFTYDESRFLDEFDKVPSTDKGVICNFLIKRNYHQNNWHNTIVCKEAVAAIQVTGVVDVED
jgi:hypothetical protein